MTALEEPEEIPTLRQVSSRGGVREGQIYSLPGAGTLGNPEFYRIVLDPQRGYIFRTRHGEELSAQELIRLQDELFFQR